VDAGGGVDSGALLSGGVVLAFSLADWLADGELVGSEAVEFFGSSLRLAAA
jgi:hypothetical protein